MLLREREGAADQQKEEAYRRENYQIFRKNLQEAFNTYNVNGDQYLSKEEFKKFMSDKAKLTGQDVSEELLEQIYLEMDVDKNGMIDCQEFMDLQFQALKNCEDNIEFLAKDIKGMDEKMKEVQVKLN